MDALPEESWDAAAVLLQRAQDPVVARLDAAPYDDEDVTAEDLSAIEEARREPAVPWTEAEAELNAD